MLNPTVRECGDEACWEKQECDGDGFGEDHSEDFSMKRVSVHRARIALYVVAIIYWPAIDVSPQGSWQWHGVLNVIDRCGSALKYPNRLIRCGHARFSAQVIISRIKSLDMCQT